MLVFVLFTLTLFIVGCFGMWLTRKHLIMVLISLELMLLAININFIIYSVLMDDMMGQLYAIVLLALAATETALGLAIVVVYYRLRGGISLDMFNLLKS